MCFACYDLAADLVHVANVPWHEPGYYGPPPKARVMTPDQARSHVEGLGLQDYDPRDYNFDYLSDRVNRHVDDQDAEVADGGRAEPLDYGTFLDHVSESHTRPWAAGPGVYDHPDYESWQSRPPVWQHTGGTAATPEHPPLPQLWNDYQDWHNTALGPDEDYQPHHSVQSWGNVEEYLQDRHGLSPYDPVALDHPVSFGMAKLHSLAQSRPQVDGHDYMLSDDDLTTGAALGLLKIRKNQRSKKLEPAWNPLDHFF